MLDWYSGIREVTRLDSLAGTAAGLVRLTRSLLDDPSKVELGLAQWKRSSPDNARRWRWQRGDNFAATGGHKIAHGRRAGVLAHSITSIRAFRAFCIPELRKLGPDGPTSYLEFGACCGTTVLSVLEHFPASKIVAFEPMADRTAVYEEIRNFVPIPGRVTWIEDIFEHHIEGVRAMFPEGLSAVYMDTNHKYPNDLWYLEALLIDRPLLAENGLL
ncbi:MAG: hypothetical protein K0V04_33660, partial [Deltaproteobacteria bacterium]|nr:hypothetical protein [Deltaproteobacteria bacterium]